MGGASNDGGVGLGWGRTGRLGSPSSGELEVLGLENLGW